MMNEASVQETSEARSRRRGVVLDVRNSDEFARGHVDGAIFMPLHAIPLRTSELDRAEIYFVVCESGARSAQACAYLAQHGYDVRSVRGGMSAWRSAGLPLALGSTEAAYR